MLHEIFMDSKENLVVVVNQSQNRKIDSQLGSIWETHQSGEG